ncbi:PREDICTED: golgin subfamily A member 6-like protein 1 [Cercocebus atys]|uniref:golgin subfamily A member 6-like protein 1 n=1 Tax=Cercocebus atys TaxID=9531 RepID=UPI0005F3A4A5|nr:PREDICTED: golgin subfamily A member 6-like protein 1 [Cercocebus atys]
MTISSIIHYSLNCTVLPTPIHHLICLILQCTEPPDLVYFRKWLEIDSSGVLRSYPVRAGFPHCNRWPRLVICWAETRRQRRCFPHHPSVIARWAAPLCPSALRALSRCHSGDRDTALPSWIFWAGREDSITDDELKEKNAELQEKLRLVESEKSEIQLNVKELKRKLEKAKLLLPQQLQEDADHLGKELQSVSAKLQAQVEENQLWNRLYQQQEVKMRRQEEKIREQEEKIREQEEKIREQEEKIQEQEEKRQEQEEKMWKQEEKIQERVKKMHEQEEKMWRQEEMMHEQEEKRREQKEKMWRQEEKIREQEKKIREQEEKIREHEEKMWRQEGKMREQEEKMWRQEEKLRDQEEKMWRQEVKLREQEGKMWEQEEKMWEQEEKMWEQEEKMWEQEEKMQEQEEKMRRQEEKMREKEEKMWRQEEKMREQESRLWQQEEKMQKQEEHLEAAIYRAHDKKAKTINM